MWRGLGWKCCVQDPAALLAWSFLGETRPPHRGGKGRPKKGEDSSRPTGRWQRRSARKLTWETCAATASRVAVRTARQPLESMRTPSLPSVMATPSDDLSNKLPGQGWIPNTALAVAMAAPFQGLGAGRKPQLPGASLRVSRRSRPLRDLLHQVPGQLTSVRSTKR